MCLTWLVHVWQDSFMCVTWLVHVCDMTRSCVWHDSFMCVTCFVHTCDKTYSYVWPNTFIRVTCLIHISHIIWRAFFTHTHTHTHTYTHTHTHTHVYTHTHTRAEEATGSRVVRLIFSKVRSLHNLLYQITIRLTVENFHHWTTKHVYRRSTEILKSQLTTKFTT